MSKHTAFDTLSIHAGQQPDPLHGAVMPAIVLSSTFAQPAPGEPLKYDYSRSGNPTRSSLEECLAALEGGRHGLAFSSGCAAALAVIHTLSPGDHVVCCDDVYGGSYRLLTKVAIPFGIRVTFASLSNAAALEQQINESTKLLWLETPTNPLLSLLDLRALSEIAHARKVRVLVDNTFASPVLQRPLELGADAVLHSTTNYLNGHSDVVGGAVITSNDQLHEKLRFLQNALGGVPSPFDCFLVIRGIKTLPLRVRHHSQAALKIAERLENHPQVHKVRYPGLASHPDHALQLRQMRAGGGMISFDVAGGLNASRAFLKALRIFVLAESLGGVESLAELPALMTHASIPREEREARGITDELVRLSVGLEDTEELWNDIEQALHAARQS